VPKDIAMLTPSTPVATPSSYDSTNTAKAAAVEANARADFRQQAQAAAQNDAHLADLAATRQAAREAATEVPDPMTSLSTIAVAGAMSSVPAALEMMRSIAVQSAAGMLTDTDRQTLHAEYAQLTAHVASTVGGVGASEAQTPTRDDERQDNAGNTWRESSDDRRSTLTQTRQVAQQTVQYQPVETSTTVQRQTLVPDGHGPQPEPHVDYRTHELHVGTDSYEPASMRQSFAHPAEPAAGRLETHAETQHSFAAQAAQITQFVQVAQTQLIPPVVAVA
jgi:flagellin-like hook-associated protein FlgL